jgi:Tol biopolymer transport system component
MTDPSSPEPSPAERSSDDRLDSWKEIAAYMRRDVTTVQRWEKREGMPVHRHVHDRMGSVYAFKADLDAWTRQRSAESTAEPRDSPAEADSGGAAPPVAPAPAQRLRWGLWSLVAAVSCLAALAIWHFRERDSAAGNPLADVRFSPLTDFDGIEEAAALSRDGKFAAFLSDRDGQMDIWITQLGTGQFHNLTRGAVRELVNPSVRSLGFSPDGTLVTFWVRREASPDQSAIGIWAVPVLGGQPRPYLEGAAELDWSADGRRLVYHTPGPGDPMYVRDDGEPHRIFSAPAGLHSHFLVWSPAQDYVYFVQGSLPDHLDIWRIKPAGGAPERITHHDSLVSHPVFAGPRTLLYLASDADGSGPWIHSIDVEQRVPRRVSGGIDRYTSLAASADGRRLVATLANPKGTLWRLPIVDAHTEMSSARRIALTTGNGSSPRLAGGALFYVSRRSSGDSIWKLQGDASAELWSAAGARVIGGPALARDGRRIAFVVKQEGQTLLFVANADGTGARAVAGTLQLQGAPAWTPDGRSLTVAAVADGVPRLVNVPLDGGSPAPLVGVYSVDPMWSPDGAFVVFSGPDIGAAFEVRAVRPDGRAYELPTLTLTRGARHVALLPGRRLVALRGEIRHKNLWVIDMASGTEAQLTDLDPGFEVRDFDVSADGAEIVLEQVREHSDVVLLEVPR